MAQVRAAAFQCRARRRERRVAASAHQRLKKASLSLGKRSWVTACAYGLISCLGTPRSCTCCPRNAQQQARPSNLSASACRARRGLAGAPPRLRASAIDERPATRTHSNQMNSTLSIVVWRACGKATMKRTHYARAVRSPQGHA